MARNAPDRRVDAPEEVNRRGRHPVDLAEPAPERSREGVGEELRSHLDGLDRGRARAIGDLREIEADGWSTCVVAPNGGPPRRATQAHRQRTCVTGSGLG